MFEKQFVDWIAHRTPPSKETLIAVGDDACLIAGTNDGTVVTTDTLCDQVHFDTETHSLSRIGRKCLAVSISDVLAMGAKPAQALLTFFFPKSWSLDQAQEIYLGVEALANAHGISIVGGDTNRYEGPLIVGSTVLGHVTPSKCWRIDGAKTGDVILVTGDFGGSILGKHLDFAPRTTWVQIVAQDYSVHAATDITDSLSLDLDYLLRQSQRGAEIYAEKIPISSAAQTLSKQTSKSPLEHALTDGEDFELSLCVSNETANQLVEKFSEVVTPIGVVTQSMGMVLFDGEDKTVLKPDGFVH